MKDVIIRDPLYGYITIPRDSIEKELIETIEFQRLRYIKQLGVSYLTYPCATHTRFSHSLGSYHLSKRLCSYLDIDSDNRKMIEIAALLHDIGHLGLSHVLEKTFTQKDHEFWTRKVIEDKETEIHQVLSKNFDPKQISMRFIKGPSEIPFHHTMISSQLDIDRFDYLLRDSYFTGNPCGVFDIERLLRVLIPKDDILTVDWKKGRYALEQYILSRYFMYNEVYNYRVTIGIEKMLKMIFKRAIEIEESEGIPPTSPILPIVNHEYLKLGDYLGLKDDCILSSIAIWRESNDTILRNLCNNFLCRKVLKSLKCSNIGRYEENIDRINRVLRYHEIEPEYNLIFLEGEEKLAYIPYDVKSKEKERDDAILFDDGTEIVENIPSLKSLTIVINPALYLPQEVHEKVKRIIGDIGG